MLQSFIDINILYVSFVIFKSERQAYGADFSMYEIIDTLQRMKDKILSGFVRVFIVIPFIVQLSERYHEPL